MTTNTRSEAGKALAALRPVKQIVCADPDCQQVVERRAPARWCSDRCKGRAAQRAFQARRKLAQKPPL